MTLLNIIVIFILAVGTNGKPSPFGQMFTGMGGCGGCNPSSCPQVSCNYGVKRDNCGCCNTCLPAPQQQQPCNGGSCQNTQQNCNGVPCPIPQPPCNGGSCQNAQQNCNGVPCPNPQHTCIGGICQNPQHYCNGVHCPSPQQTCNGGSCQNAQQNCNGVPCPSPQQPCNGGSCPGLQQLCSNGPCPSVMINRIVSANQQCGCGTNCAPSGSNCIHGNIQNPSCGCCNQCASGPGEQYGHGCANGLQRQGNICSYPSTGQIQGHSSNCGCASNGCSPKPQGCHFGIAVSSSCPCCKTCASGPGMPCILHAGGSNCGHGLSCVQGTCQTTVVQNSISVVNSGGCACAQAQGAGCATPQTNCMYGQVSSGSCGCCKQCASGMGQPCGQGCAQGLQCNLNTCVNNGYPVVQGMSGPSSSTCGGCGTSPIGIPSNCNCAATSCPAISGASCQYGMKSDACGCCNVCAAAPGGSCGAAVGVSPCSQNHYCNRGSCSHCQQCGK